MGFIRFIYKKNGTEKKPIENREGLERMEIEREVSYYLFGIRFMRAQVKDVRYSPPLYVPRAPKTKVKQ